MPRRLTADMRDTILRGARVAFGRRGYHATSISEIVAAAGVARGTFYKYFDSKRDAFAAILDDLVLVVWQQVRPIRPASAKDVRRQIHENVEALCRTLIDNLDLARILLAEAIGVDPEFDEKIRNFYHRLLALVEESLREGQTLRLVRDADRAALAMCLVGAVKEMLFQYMLGTRRLDARAMARELERLVFEGIFAA
ncbi:MAG TPA: helix-turn-helix domain-containing protein [Myxococcota bacterium]|jgi:AcrR family transcriptional regulator|nr:helix-turn-helix domain-containing protein [Myxococcota bacterium]